jgi:hypothetical protein
MFAGNSMIFRPGRPLRIGSENWLACLEACAIQCDLLWEQGRAHISSGLLNHARMPRDSRSGGEFSVEQW